MCLYCSLSVELREALLSQLMTPNRLALLCTDRQPGESTGDRTSAVYFPFTCTLVTGSQILHNFAQFNPSPDASCLRCQLLNLLADLLLALQAWTSWCKISTRMQLVTT